MKYRRDVLLGQVDIDIKDLLQQIAQDNDIIILEIESDSKPIHLLIECKPQHYIPNVLKAFKGVSARRLLKQHPELKHQLWGGHLWNPSYFVATISENTEEQIRKYIQSQKKKWVPEMLQHKAYKFRIYPNKVQAILIAKTIGCARFVYNHFLQLWNETYLEKGKGLSYHSCSALLPKMKNAESTLWLKEVDSIALQSSLKYLADSFSRFFNKQNSKPQFKSKNNPVQSYTTQFTNNNIVVSDKYIKLPKLGLVKFAKSRAVKGRIINATIRKNASDSFFVSILCEEDIHELPKTNMNIGIDLGITDFAILSDGRKMDNHTFTSRMEKKLKREQRKLSRRALHAKEKGINLFDAKNYQKQKLKVARLHGKVANQRNDFLNKLSTEIIKSHDIICIEDLHTKGMLRNRKLAKSISDVSWSRFVTKLQYKADWYGRKVIKVDRWFPSSQICSNCSHQDGKKALDIRKWICTKCHAHHDRDINASRNILNEGLKLQTLA